MARSFTGDAVEEIKSRCDLVEVVNERIRLEKKGKNYVGLCPFHQEKTPSFTVSQEKQLYHCFGCGASGDLFSFIMQTENLTFPEALRFLAEQTGVALPDEKADSPADKQKEAFYAINELAMRFYHYVLCERPEGKKALQYLKKRGVENSSVESFKVGFAPDKWDGFLNTAVKKGYSADALVQAGLAVRRDDGKGFYDRFRNRIMFPILDYRKRVIGFGGRILDDDEKGPKYLNSPATMLFDKRRVLFGIERALPAIRKNKAAVVVEGYTDVIMTHQEGIENTVASLGTAFTPMQARALRAQADDVIIAFDADTAGEAATERGLDILNNSGCHVKVAEFPEGLDPDSFIRNSGKEAFNSILQGARPLTEYRLENLKRRYDLNKTEEKLRYIKDILPVLSGVNDALEREEYLKRMAEELDVAEEALRSELKKNANIKRKTEKNGNNLGKIEQTNYIRLDEIEPAEKVILSLLFSYKGVFDKVVERMSETYFSANVEKILIACKQLREENREIRSEQLRNYFDDEALHVLVATMDFNSPWDGFSDEKVMQVVDDCMLKLKIKKLVIDREKVEKQLKEMEKAGTQGEPVKKLLAEWESLKQAEQELYGSGKKEG